MQLVKSITRSGDAPPPLPAPEIRLAEVLSMPNLFHEVRGQLRDSGSKQLPWLVKKEARELSEIWIKLWKAQMAEQTPDLRYGEIHATLTMLLTGTADQILFLDDDERKLWREIELLVIEQITRQFYAVNNAGHGKERAIPDLLLAPAWHRLWDVHLCNRDGVDVTPLSLFFSERYFSSAEIQQTLRECLPHGIEHYLPATIFQGSHGVQTQFPFKYLFLEINCGPAIGSVYILRDRGGEDTRVAQIEDIRAQLRKNVVHGAESGVRAMRKVLEIVDPEATVHYTADCISALPEFVERILQESPERYVRAAQIRSRITGIFDESITGDPQFAHTMRAIIQNLLATNAQIAPILAAWSSVAPVARLALYEDDALVTALWNRLDSEAQWLMNLEWCKTQTHAFRELWYQYHYFQEQLPQPQISQSVFCDLTLAIGDRRINLKRSPHYTDRKSHVELMARIERYLHSDEYDRAEQLIDSIQLGDDSFVSRGYHERKMHREVCRARHVEAQVAINYHPSCSLEELIEPMLRIMTNSLGADSPAARPFFYILSQRLEFSFEHRELFLKVARRKDTPNLGFDEVTQAVEALVTVDGVRLLSDTKLANMRGFLARKKAAFTVPPIKTV